MAAAITSEVLHGFVERKLRREARLLADSMWDASVVLDDKLRKAKDKISWLEYAYNFNHEELDNLSAKLDSANATIAKQIEALKARDADYIELLEQKEVFRKGMLSLMFEKCAVLNPRPAASAKSRATKSKGKK